MKTKQSLQDQFLTEVQKSHSSITVYLSNGFQIRGLVEAFDNKTLVMDTSDGQQIIYKHAIITLVPSRRTEFFDVHSSN